MSLLTTIMRQLMFERPARKLDYGDFARILREKGGAVEARIEKGNGEGKQHSALTHVIGIEKWAQSRVRAGLGEPLNMDEEYTVYRPAKGTDWSDLLPIFRETRAESVALAEELSAENVPPEKTVPHNQFGDMTMRGWLQYIIGHADFESKRIAR